MRSKTIGALVLAVTASMGSGCATSTPLTPNKTYDCNFHGATTMEAKLYAILLKEEAALYIRKLEDSPALAFNGIFIPPPTNEKYAELFISLPTNKEHARCLDPVLRNDSEGKYGVIPDGVGDHVAIGVTW